LTDPFQNESGYFSKAKEEISGINKKPNRQGR
jgi:hypothetical protein